MVVPLGVTWNPLAAPYASGPWVPPDLTDAQRRWMAERLEGHANTYPSFLADDIRADTVAELAARARKEIP